MILASDTESDQYPSDLIDWDVMGMQIIRNNSSALHLSGFIPVYLRGPDEKSEFGLGSVQTQKLQSVLLCLTRARAAARCSRL